jgi:glycosyltransferase involved in cell wall biosynthesis
MSLVSVIIPTFNRESTIERAINSVLKQTHTNLECIVVDDCSNDNTKKLVLSFNDKRVKYIKNDSNCGVSYSRNVGFVNSTGEYIALLDSDDEWFKNKLEKQIPLLCDYVLVHGEEVWIRNGKKINQKNIHKKSGGYIFNRCLHLCLISPSASIMRRELYKEMSGFREDFPVCEDYELWLRITSQYEIGFVDTPVINKYGGHEDQLSHKFKAMDYWRVLAMDKLRGSGVLSKKQTQSLEEVLIAKCIILKKGYEKHNNTKDLPYIDRLLNE